MTVTGIVLAGGRSSRFGGSKLDADLAGRSVLDHTIQALAEACSEVIVVGRSQARPAAAPAGAPAAAPAAAPVAARYLEDRAGFEGPLVGVARGLEEARGDVVIVVGGDMPLERAAVLRLMAARLVANPLADGLVLEDAGESRPLPLALRRQPAELAAARAIEAGERSLRALLAGLHIESVPHRDWRDLDPDGDTLLDIDTPAELERAKDRLDM